MEGTFDKEVEEILKEITPSISDAIREAFAEIIAKARYFTTYQDLTRYVIGMLESSVSLSTKDKEKLSEMLRKIYIKEQASLPVKTDIKVSDERAINYAVKLHDFYLGKFFQGDRQLRLDTIRWMSNYFLEKGYPIGKGQEGIDEFLDKFGEYLSQMTETKARQIIDTSLNFMRNSARLRGMEKANISKYRWDATGDRLTCPACRSMDGRIFEVRDAIRVLDMLEGSEDPTLIKELRPIQTTLQKGASSNLPVKSPPLHPLCRCRVVAYLGEVNIQTTVERPSFAKDTPLQRELEDEYSALTNEERINKIKAHLGADWLRPSKGGKGVNAYKEAKNRLHEHFLKHSEELGYNNEQEYAKGVYPIIRNPEAVFVERSGGKTYYHFIKDDKVVLTGDDTLEVITFYPYEEKRWRSKAKDAIIRIL
jgi:SPP1 gp7 family putative phage head morphogenesis protein